MYHEGDTYNSMKRTSEKGKEIIGGWWWKENGKVDGEEEKSCRFYL